LSRNVSVDVGVVRGTASDGRIDLRLTLFSSSARRASVALLYREDFLHGWMSDARIVASNARFVSGNEMHCLPCSPQGEESRLTWHHAANGVAPGSRLDVKAVVLPSVSVACSSGSFSRVETAFRGGTRHIDAGMPGVVVGFDPAGNAVKVEDHRVSILDRDSWDEVASATVASKVSHAVGTGDGIIVVGDDGWVREFDMDGDQVEALDATAFAGEGATIALGERTGTLLVAGGAVPAVTEVFWGDDSHGDVLWSYACPAGSHPVGPSYADGVGTVVFCERDAGKVVVIDRTASPEDVMETSSVTAGGESVPLSSPVRCAAAGGVVYVVEESGVARAFGSSPSTHPALARASGEGPFAGMCFLPIARSVR
jgi:hypothetical protein